jgi:hypothetical protein
MSLELPAKALREGREVLAIPIGASRNQFALTKLSGLRTSPGFRVAPPRVEEWYLEGFFTLEERLALYGSWEPGALLEEILDRSAEDFLPFLIRLLEALLALGERRPESLQTDAVRFLEDGAVLLLPPEVMKQVRALLPPEHRLATYELLNHPDLTGSEARLGFSIAALLYRLIGGEYPFRAPTEEEVRHRARHLSLVPLALLRPGLKEEVSAAVAAGLGRSREEAPSLERWLQLIRRWQAQGLYRALSEEERRRLEEQARRQDERASRSFRRRVFWQKHWKTVLVAAVAACAVGIFSATILKNLLKPRSTRGYGPARVVETFYRSINSLDHERMRDCVTGRAGKQLIEQVINVFVISRVNLGYEGRSHLIAADEWDRSGRPDLQAPDAVFGITDLVIREERGGPQPRFLVSYTRWLPQSAGEPRGGSGSVGLPARERVHLRQKGGYWVIDRIEALSQGG